ARTPAAVQSCPSPAAGKMHELELDSVGIAEEHGIVAGHVVGVLARQVGDAAAPLRNRTRQRIDLLATLRLERDLAQADAILAKGIARKRGIRPLDPETAPGAEPAHTRPISVGILPTTGIAQLRHELRVKRTGAVEVLDRDEHVMNAVHRRTSP